MAQIASGTPSGPSAEGLFELPTGWKVEYTRFIRDLAAQGEDAGSILILFQTEFPDFELGREEGRKGVIKKIMAET